MPAIVRSGVFVRLSLLYLAAGGLGCGSPDSGSSSPTSPGEPAASCTRRIEVATDAALTAALGGAAPGDCIVLADGTYSGFTTSVRGTPAEPITVRAAHRGRATVASGGIFLNGAAHVILEGLKVTGYSVRSVDGTTRRLGIGLQDAQHCRVTRCFLQIASPPVDTHWVGIGGNSSHNRVDHCDLGPFAGTGKQVYIYPAGNARISGVTNPADRTPWAEGRGPFNPNVARDTLIDHNYLHDKAPGSSEPIILCGIGMTCDYQDTNTVVEYNLFENAHGDSETISVKSSSNVIRYNTIRTTGGGFVSRAGNKNQFIGNFILQGGVTGSAGVRLHEKDHVVYNNYIENTASEPINVYSGDPYDGAFTHAQVFRARIVHNTIVGIGGRAVTMGGGGNLLPPQDVVFANNLLAGSARLLNLAIPGNTSFHSNIASGNLGHSMSQGEFWMVDPQLRSEGGLLRIGPSSPAIGYADAAYYSFVTDDMDGQPRSDPDVGADEYATGGMLRRPLTRADVGPEAP